MARPLSGALWLGIIAWLSFAGEAHAYLDPGTGSMLLQAAIGSIAAGLVVGRIYWHRLKALFTRGAPGEGRRKETTPDEQTETARKP
jgi:hypothetical protein